MLTSWCVQADINYAESSENLHQLHKHLHNYTIPDEKSIQRVCPKVAGMSLEVFETIRAISVSYVGGDLDVFQKVWELNILCIQHNENAQQAHSVRCNQQLSTHNVFTERGLHSSVNETCTDHLHSSYKHLLGPLLPLHRVKTYTDKVH